LAAAAAVAPIENQNNNVAAVENPIIG